MDIKSNDRLIHQIVKQATKDAVIETLDSFGVETSQPYKMRADMLYLRKQREASEDVIRRIKFVAIGVIIPAIIYMLWESLQNIIG